MTASSMMGGGSGMSVMADGVCLLALPVIADVAVALIWALRSPHQAAE
ncbi:MAG: hypothetical protein ACRDJE_27685 [Dehalococcoidia bacterium]